jgi:beta-lactamase superfamily II metal-dependent hydrolase
VISLARFLLFAAFSVCAVVSVVSASPLRMYFVDVEGGQSTLIVAPNGQSMLIDAGWPGFAGRDAKRIMEAAKAAGLSQIDYVLVTHYHDDHVGGVPQLLEQVKVGTFLDHGPNREDSDDTRGNYVAYEKAVAQAKAKRRTVKPGDRFSLGEVEIEVLAADGQLLREPLPGAGESNAFCASQPPAEEDPSENSRSAGVVLQYGKLRILDLGDLTKKKELELACPKNLVGSVDLFVVTHHASSASNPQALVHALHPRVAIMDNGPHKGANPDAWEVVQQAPGLADLWQLHSALDAGKEHNVSADRIANLEENCQGKPLLVSAESDGTITVTNPRNQFSRTYRK